MAQNGGECSGAPAWLLAGESEGDVDQCFKMGQRQSGHQNKKVSSDREVIQGTP